MIAGVEAVVFDLDGTLVDSWDVHSACLRIACQVVGCPPPSSARLRAGQRETDRGTIVALVGEQKAGLAAAAYDGALLACLERESPAPMPDVIDTLERLTEAGIRFGVCTGRSRLGAEAIVRASNLLVTVLVAREDADAPKPAPDGLLAAIAALGSDPGSALFIGDAEADARQGAAAGVRTALVSTSPPGQPGITTLTTVAEAFT